MEKLKNSVSGKTAPNAQSTVEGGEPDAAAADPLANFSAKGRLGMEIKEAMEKKMPVPDDVVAQLLLLTMLHLEEYVAAPGPSNPGGVTKGGKVPTKAAAPKKPITKAGKAGVAGGPSSPTQQSGFVLDGFPTTDAQAAALEKYLTGLDLNVEEKKKKEKASRIAPPPPPEVVKKLESGLDMYLVVEAISAEEATERALGKVVDPKTGAVYHHLFNPIPVSDKTGIAERVQRVESEEVVQGKIETGVAEWELLQLSMSKFGNIQHVPQVAVTEADGKKRTVDVKAASALIAELIDSKVRKVSAAYTATIAQEVDGVAKQARADAEKIGMAAQELARVFFAVKLAEVEAEQAALPAAPETTPIAGKKPAATPIKGKPGGAVKEKPSDAIIKKLDSVSKLMQEAQVTSAAAAAATEEAHQHAREAQVAGDTESVNHCKIEAEKAAAAAKQAAAKVAQASEQAAAELQSANDIAQGNPPDPPSKAGKVGKAALPVLKAPPTKTGRDAPNAMIKMNFVEQLQELNGKQKLFDEFQGKYNRINYVQRYQKHIIKKLYKEAAQFAEVLRKLCIDRLEKGKFSEQKQLEDLLQERMSTFTNLFTDLVQAELDRHLESCSLLHDFFSGKVGSMIARDFHCNLSAARRVPSWAFAIPKWLVPLEGSFPELHVVLCEALSVACNFLAVFTGKGGIGDKKVAKKKNPSRRLSGRRTTWLTVNTPTSREEVQLDPAAHPVIAREHQILYYRLELIGRLACTYVAELQPVIDGAYGHLDAWLMKRCNDECEVVEEIISVVKDSIRENIPLWYRMWMEDQEFQVDKDDIKMIVHVPPEPIEDLTPWHIRVMESLAQTFKNFTGGFSRVEQVLDATIQAIDNVYMMYQDDPRYNMYPRLPRTKSRRYGHFQHWANLAHEIIKLSSQGQEKAGFTAVIDWRAFLVSLADAHFDYCISASTLDDIVLARTDFFLVVATKKIGHPTEGWMTLDDFLKTKVWFDKSSNNEEEDNDDDEIDYNFPAALKTFVYSVLDVNGDPGLPWQTLLLYLCRDESQEMALRKAFTVLSCNTSPEDVALNPEELLQALYPGGVDGALAAGCIPWTTIDLQDVLYAVGVEKHTPIVEPRTVASYVSSTPEEKLSEPDTTICSFLGSNTSSNVSQMSESEAETVREFLACVVPDGSKPSSSELQITSPLNVPTDDDNDDEQLSSISEYLTVDDVIKCSAAAKLRSALSATFQQLSVNFNLVAAAVDDYDLSSHL
ncbi:hypothetical protein BDL97_05G088400 [Sphagnum fallax]|nr:hypothetical protein BDL97_05G088400 [Sphagnum fallax]